MEERIIGINIINGDAIPLNSTYGRHLSTTTTINSNKLGTNSYSVIYTKNDFVQLDPRRFAISVINVFRRNLPAGPMRFVMELINPDGVEDELVEHMNDVLSAFQEIISVNFKSGDIHIDVGENFADILVDMYGLFDDDEDDEYDDEDNEEDSDDPFTNIMSMYPNKAKKKEYYGRSRVFKDSKNPKKEFHRHGVIVADSKSDIEKDMKTIKDFLKDFIPGKQSWKKEIRKELAERWIKMYTVSKKQLKSLEHSTRKNVSNKRKAKNTKKTLEFTKKLFTIPIDSWSDPNK